MFHKHWWPINGNLSGEEIQMNSLERIFSLIGRRLKLKTSHSRQGNEETGSYELETSRKQNRYGISNY